MANPTIGNYEADAQIISGRVTTYLQVGSSTAPTNVTAGDLTLERISIANTAFVANSLITINHTADTVARAGYIRITPTVNLGASSTVIGLSINITYTPTVNVGATAAGVLGQLISGGTFNVGTLEGLDYLARHNSTGTSAGVKGLVIAANVGSLAVVAGAATKIHGIELGVGISGASVVSTQPVTRGIQTTLLGGSATAQMTTVVGYDLVAPTGFSGITTTGLYGIRLANLSANGTHTDVIGIDIATLTAGSGQTAGIRNLDYYIMGPKALPTVAPAAGNISMFSFAKATGVYQDTPRFYDSSAHDSGTIMRAVNVLPTPRAPAIGTFLGTAVPSTTLGFVGLVTVPTGITLHAILYNIGTAGTGTGLEAVRLAVYTESGSLITGTNVTDSPALATGQRTVTLGADVYLPAGSYYIFCCISTASNLLNPAISCWNTDNTFGGSTATKLCGTVVCVGGAAPSPLGTITSTTNRTPYFMFNGAAT